MDDAVIVQVGRARRDAAEPEVDLVERQAVGIAVDRVLQACAGDVLHDDPGVALIVVADVVEVDQVRVLEVEALADAAQLDVEVPLDVLEGDFLAGVADGEIDLAEAAAADAALDGVAFQRAGNRWRKGISWHRLGQGQPPLRQPDRRRTRS